MEQILPVSKPFRILLFPVDGLDMQSHFLSLFHQLKGKKKVSQKFMESDASMAFFLLTSLAYPIFQFRVPSLKDALQFQFHLKDFS